MKCRLRGDELSLPSHGTVLGKLLRFAPGAKGVGATRLENLPGKSFDPRLGTHKIHHLSAIHKRTVYAVNVDADLRVVFIIENETVWSLEVGTHEIYEE
jgi:hypothetical protein